jgi:iron complex transport system substrate-binding protein
MRREKLAAMKFYFTAMIFLFTFSSAWADSSIVMHDVLNQEIVLSAPAKKVVSLVPATTEILFAIGAGEKVIGLTEFCNYPEETKDVEKIGGFSGASVSIEKIILLQPDIVFVSADMHFRIIDLLNQVGIKSFSLEPKNMEDIFSSITMIGQLTDCEDGAFKTILQMKKKIEQAKVLSMMKEKVSVFWEIWNNPLMTSGANTFINEAIELSGGKNIFDDVASSWPEVSTEQVIMRNPKWIMSDNTYGMNITQEALRQRPGWSMIDAVRNNRIGMINADMIMRAGPRLADAILQMAELFHGDTSQR